MEVPTNVIISAASYMVGVGIWVGVVTVSLKNEKLERIKLEKSVKSNTHKFEKDIKDRRHVNDCQSTLAILQERRDFDLKETNSMLAKQEVLQEQQQEANAMLLDISTCMRLIQKNLSCD